MTRARFAVSRCSAPVAGSGARAFAVLLAFLVFLVLLVGGRAATARADEPSLVTYVVTEPTTCDRLAIKLWGDRAKFLLIHEHNDLGPLPHRLVPGQRLVIPIFSQVSPDATVSRTEGTVQARPPRELDWRSAGVGTLLFRAWRVFSREQSLAEVTYRDASRITLRENTVVVIYGPSYGPSTGGAVFAEAELETGTLRARLGELAGEGSLVVRTEVAEAALAPGAAIIGAVVGGRTVVANHEGRPLRVRGRRSDRPPAPAVVVDAGMGTDVERGQDPAPPRPLPRAPAWLPGPAVFVALEEGRGAVEASWGAVPGARSYHLELARDAAGSEVIGQVNVAADVTSYRGEGLRPGTYFLSVATLDPGGLEGLPSPRRRMVVAAATRAPGVKTTTVGTVVSAPDGTRCSIDGDEPRERLVLRTAGKATVRCGNEETALEVSPLPIALRRAPGNEVAIVVDGPAELVAAVQLEGPPGVRLTRRADGVVVVTGNSDASVVIVRAYMSIEGERFLVSTLSFPRPARGSRIGVGWTVLGGAYRDFTIGGVEPTAALVTGMRVAGALSDRFSVELELTAGGLRLPRDTLAPTLMYGGRFLARLGSGAVRPILGVGGTLQQVFATDRNAADAVGGPHLLGGVEIGLTRVLVLRAEVQTWLVWSDDDLAPATWFGGGLGVRL